MRVLKIMSMLALGSALAVPATALAQAPKTGWRAEFLGNFEESEKKYMALAEAVP